MIKLPMSLKTRTPKNIEELKSILDEKIALMFVGARTSTVLPFSKPDHFKGTLVDLSCLPKKIEFISNEQVRVTGPISWQELRSFLLDSGLEVGCWPTDQSALVLSGLATSATGERCFSHGMVRDHVQSLRYLDYLGEEVELFSSIEIKDNFLSDYRAEYETYRGFKNAPFPRLEKQTDLMIGTEGQLGVITSVVLKVFKRRTSSYLLVPVKSWLESDKSVDYMSFAQTRRDSILSVEFFDRNCISLCGDKSLNQDRDYIVLEVDDSRLEEIVEEVVELDSEFDLNNALILDEAKFLALRVSIPRSVNEFISHNSLTKMGTDAQVHPINFQELLGLYREMSKKDLCTAVLFGHLGDCHLHYNFLPGKSQVQACGQILESFYVDLKKIKGSPFAEHGIGIIKLKYIDLFYNDRIRETFKYLKKKMDPQGIFFPQGFMNL